LVGLGTVKGLVVAGAALGILAVITIYQNQIKGGLNYASQGVTNVSEAVGTTVGSILAAPLYAGGNVFNAVGGGLNSLFNAMNSFGGLIGLPGDTYTGPGSTSSSSTSSVTGSTLSTMNSPAGYNLGVNATVSGHPTSAAYLAGNPVTLPIPPMIG
jgi:hypothetical protein